MAPEKGPHSGLSSHNLLHTNKHAPTSHWSISSGQLKLAHLSMMGLSGGVSRSSSSQYSLFT